MSDEAPKNPPERLPPWHPCVVPGAAWTAYYRSRLRPVHSQAELEAQNDVRAVDPPSNYPD